MLKRNIHVSSLGNLLLLRWKRTLQIHAIAQETFHKLAKGNAAFYFDIHSNAIHTDGEVLEETVHHWVSEEAAVVADSKISKRSLHEYKGLAYLHPFNFAVPIPAWKSEYFVLLQSYINLREKLTQTYQPHQQRLCLCREVSKLSVQLEELEGKHHVPHRWTPDDSEYVQVLESFSAEKKTYVTESLWATSARRQFLLKLKAKYADGQKIAKKLSTQISKETQKLKALLQEYNACHIATTGDSGILSFADVMDSSKLSQTVSPYFSYSTDKHELIEAYLLLTRSAEELHMLECDMKNVISYYENRIKVLTVAMENPSEVTLLCENGARALLQNLLQETNQQLHKCRQLFSSCLYPPQSLQLNDSDSDLSSEDYDSDSDV